MVDPDEVGLVDGDGVASPDVLGVDVGDGDVLNDDVLSTADDTKALALDDAGGALADEGLVGVDGDTKRAGIIIGHRDRGSTRLVVGAPVILVDGYLAARGSTPRRAASRGGGTLGSSKVKGLGKHNHTGLAITKVRDQLVGGGRIDGGSAATASHGRGKTLGGALDANRNGLGDQRTDGGKKSSVLHPGSRHRTNDRVK